MKCLITFLLFIVLFINTSLAQPEIEPNDTFEQATEVSVNQEITGSISDTPPNQEQDRNDWFLFEIEQAGHVTLHQTHTPAGRGFQLILFGTQNLDESILATFDHLQETTSHDTALMPGTYYLHLFGLMAPSNRDYQMSIEFTPVISTIDDFETDNTREQASDLPLNATHSAMIGFTNSINQSDQEDWYRFTLSETDITFFQADFNTTEAELLYRFYPAGDDTAIVESEPDLTTSVKQELNLEPGDYELQLINNSGHIGVEYAIRLETTSQSTVKNWTDYGE